MKTAEDKAKVFASMDEFKVLPQPEQFIAALARLLKEQDRDTRHACAEAVIAVEAAYEAPTGTDLIDRDAAHNAVMNTKAV